MAKCFVNYESAGMSWKRQPIVELATTFFGELIEAEPSVLHFSFPSEPIARAWMNAAQAMDDAWGTIAAQLKSVGLLQPGARPSN